MKKSPKAKSAFTLIEIMVSIALFSIIIGGFLGLFSSAFFQQRRSFNISYLLNNGSFVSEYVSRALRMAQKEISSPPECLSSYGLNYELTRAGEGIKFINYLGDCQEFFLEDNILKVSKNGMVQSLTPSDLEARKLKFSLSGESQDDFLQPRVTFVLELKTSGDPPQSINIQTTVSQRELDVGY